MKKRAKVILITIIIVAVLMALLYLISILTGINMTGKVTGLFQKTEAIDQVYVESTLEGFIDKANEEEKYLQFINESEYESMELIIAKQGYYLKYDSETNKVLLTEQQEVNFSMKITAKKFNKIIELYKEGDVKGAGMKIVGEIPRKVKINLFKQCMATEWCKQCNF